MGSVSFGYDLYYTLRSTADQHGINCRGF